MNEDIMLLSNKLIYKDRLRCGNDQVARRTLKLPNRKSCTDIGESSCVNDCWIQNLLAEGSTAVFVDTDAVPAQETRAGDLVQNPAEAELIFQLSKALVSCGVRQHDIALITPYRQQIKLISRLIAPSMPNIDVLTADRAQGRDKDVIIVSLVRSNDGGHVGELLRDWRRINVSFTRAKKKLVVFGSRKTLGKDQLLKRFITLMDDRHWIRTLPAGAGSLHVWHDADAEDAQPDGDDPAKAKKKCAVLGSKLLSKHPFTAEILEHL